MTLEMVTSDPDEVRRRKIEFAHCVGAGLSLSQAASHVGVHANQATKYMKDPIVKNELRSIHEEIKKDLKMTRQKVQDIVLDAINMGRMITDPMAMIRGAQELNKMCGFYAPEVKQLELTTSQRRLLGQFDNMSDDQLLELVEDGQMYDAIEAEFEEIPATSPSELDDVEENRA